MRFCLSAAEPTAVLRLPCVLSVRALKPRAVLSCPVVRSRRASVPTAVLPSGYPPPGGGSTACIFGSAAERQRNARNNRIIVFIGIELRKISLICREKPQIALFVTAQPYEPNPRLHCEAAD